MKTIWDKDTGLMKSHNEGRRSFFGKLFAGFVAVRMLGIPNYEEPELPKEKEVLPPPSTAGYITFSKNDPTTSACEWNGWDDVPENLK